MKYKWHMFYWSLSNEHIAILLFVCIHCFQGGPGGLLSGKKPKSVEVRLKRSVILSLYLNNCSVCPTHANVLGYRFSFLCSILTKYEQQQSSYSITQTQLAFNSVKKHFFVASETGLQSMPKTY